nr:MAG TPA: hypothetical protein [Caudoviricetes sp.]
MELKERSMMFMQSRTPLPLKRGTGQMSKATAALC